MPPHPVLRVARASDDLDALLPSHRDGLGLDVLARFADHDNFDGLVLGRAGAPCHLEFTRMRGRRADRRPTADDLPAFYPPFADGVDLSMRLG